MLEEAKRLIMMISQMLPSEFGPNEVRGIIRKLNITNGTNYTVSNGATRIVILSKDFVVKFEYGYDVKYFGGNKSEAKMYKKAKKAGFEYLFAKPTLIEENGITFNVMPRIEGVGDYTKYLYSYLTSKEANWLRHSGIKDLHEKNYGFIGDKPVIIDYACNDDKNKVSTNEASTKSNPHIVTRSNPYVAPQGALKQKFSPIKIKESACLNILKSDLVIADHDGDNILAKRNPFAKKQTALSSLPF